MKDSYSSSLLQMSERSDPIHISLKEGWISLTTPKAYRRWIFRHFYQCRNTQLLPNWCSTGKTELHRRRRWLPSPHYTLNPSRPPPTSCFAPVQRLSSFCTFTWTSTPKNCIHYELEEVRSTFCCNGPPALWHFHVLLLWKASSIYALQSSPIVASFHWRKRWTISLRAAAQRKSLEGKLWK